MRLVNIDPPITEHGEFRVMWLNRKEEASKPTHYLCTREDLQHIFNAGMAYMAGKGITLDEYLKLQGVEND